jgi:hypothetical protein
VDTKSRRVLTVLLVILLVISIPGNAVIAAGSEESPALSIGQKSDKVVNTLYDSSPAKANTRTSKRSAVSASTSTFTTTSSSLLRIAPNGTTTFAPGGTYALLLTTTEKIDSPTVEVSLSGTAGAVITSADGRNYDEKTINDRSATVSSDEIFYTNQSVVIGVAVPETAGDSSVEIQITVKQLDILRRLVNGHNERNDGQPGACPRPGRHGLRGHVQPPQCQ